MNTYAAIKRRALSAHGAPVSTIRYMWVGARHTGAAAANFVKRVRPARDRAARRADISSAEPRLSAASRTSGGVGATAAAPAGVAGHPRAVRRSARRGLRSADGRARPRAPRAGAARVRAAKIVETCVSSRIQGSSTWVELPCAFRMQLHLPVSATTYAPATLFCLERQCRGRQRDLGRHTSES